MIGGFNDTLDRTVAAAHAAAARAGTHPHVASWGAAALAIPAAAGVAGAAVGAGALAPAGAATVVLLAYLRAYLPLKRAIVPDARRQLFLDLALFVGPAWLVAAVAFGVRVDAAADVLALAAPPAMAILRAGCFLGGCCHGRTAAFGVRYGDGPRVLPLPLFEIVAVVVLEATLVASIGHGPLLPRALVGYGLYRAIAEAFRPAPRTLGLTKTQILSAVSVVIGGVTW